MRSKGLPFEETKMIFFIRSVSCHVWQEFHGEAYQLPYSLLISQLFFMVDDSNCNVRIFSKIKELEG